MIRNFVTATVAAALLAGTASADTLREALVSAYRSNPTLTGQREALRATDANVAIAKAAGRPQVSATAGINRDLSRSGILETGGGTTFSAGADLSVPLYTGGRVKNSVKAAQTRVEAGRATLRAVEGDVFTQAVSSYMDVIRDRAVVELNANNVRVLETNLQATQDRFQIGDLTRTDVAQSEARLQLGRSRLVIAQGQQTASEAVYRQVIGHAPGQLAPPPPLPPLPTTEVEAVRIALANNPDLLSIQRQSIAAGYDVRVAEGTRLPTLSGVLSGTYVNEMSGTVGNFPSTGSQTTAGLSASIPVFQGGLPAARIRQAEALEGQTLEQVIGTERAVVSTTRAAFASYEASLKAIQSQTVAVSANELALEGVRAEQSVGTRTVLDVLDAEQELLNSQVLLVTARRDAYVAGFQLLNAMGQAEAQDLGLDGGPLYDPLGNYRRVANNWNDWARDPKYVPVATRTVDPAEMPATPIVTPDLIPPQTIVTPPAAGTTATPSVTQPPQQPISKLMQASGREPSMEEILASIKKVIAEDKGARSFAEPVAQAEETAGEEEEDVLELENTLAPPADLGPPLLDESVANVSRSALEQLSTVAATVPAMPQVNPLEDMVKEMLRPMLKQWLDEHLPGLVDEHVKREISRITGRPL